MTKKDHAHRTLPMYPVVNEGTAPWPAPM